MSAWVRVCVRAWVRECVSARVCVTHTVFLFVVVRRSRVIVVRGIPTQLLRLGVKHGHHVFCKQQKSPQKSPIKQLQQTHNTNKRACVRDWEAHQCVRCRAEECWGRWTRRPRWSNWSVFHPSQDPQQTKRPAFCLFAEHAQQNDTVLFVSGVLWGGVTRARQTTPHLCRACRRSSCREPTGPAQGWWRAVSADKTCQCHHGDDCWHATRQTRLKTATFTIRPSLCLPPRMYKLPSLGSGRKPGLQKAHHHYCYYYHVTTFLSLSYLQVIAWNSFMFSIILPISARTSLFALVCAITT